MVDANQLSQLRNNYRTATLLCMSCRNQTGMLGIMDAMEDMGLCPTARTWRTLTSRNGQARRGAHARKPWGARDARGNYTAPDISSSALHPSVAQLHQLGAQVVACQERTLFVVASCHSTWFFDPSKERFCRRLAGPDDIVTMWQGYFGIEVDPDAGSFVILLNSAGTRLLRSWRHTAGCTKCSSHATIELSLAAIRDAAAGFPVDRS